MASRRRAWKRSSSRSNVVRIDLSAGSASAGAWNRTRSSGGAAGGCSAARSSTSALLRLCQSSKRFAASMPHSRALRALLAALGPLEQKESTARPVSAAGRELAFCLPAPTPGRPPSSCSSRRGGAAVEAWRLYSGQTSASSSASARSARSGRSDHMEVRARGTAEVSTQGSGKVSLSQPRHQAPRAGTTSPRWPPMGGGPVRGWTSKTTYAAGHEEITCSVGERGCRQGSGRPDQAGGLLRRLAPAPLRRKTAAPSSGLARCSRERPVTGPAQPDAPAADRGRGSGGEAPVIQPVAPGGPDACSGGHRVFP